MCTFWEMEVSGGEGLERIRRGYGEDMEGIWRGYGEDMGKMIKLIKYNINCNRLGILTQNYKL